MVSPVIPAVLGASLSRGPWGTDSFLFEPLGVLGIHVYSLFVIPKDVRTGYMQLIAQPVAANTLKGNDSKDGMIALQGFPKWP